MLMEAPAVHAKPESRALQALAGAAIYPLAGDEFIENPDSAADAAYCAIIWWRGIDKLIREDSRFSDRDDKVASEPDRSHNDVNDRSCIVNRYGEDFAFQIGFDFALELGARLAMNPMGTVDASDLLETARNRTADRLSRYRDQLWSDTQRARAARKTP